MLGPFAWHGLDPAEVVSVRGVGPRSVLAVDRRPHVVNRALVVEEVGQLGLSHHL